MDVGAGQFGRRRLIGQFDAADEQIQAERAAYVVVLEDRGASRRGRHRRNFLIATEREGRTGRRQVVGNHGVVDRQCTAGVEQPAAALVGSVSGRRVAVACAERNRKFLREAEDRDRRERRSL